MLSTKLMTIFGAILGLSVTSTFAGKVKQSELEGNPLVRGIPGKTGSITLHAESESLESATADLQSLP